MHNVRAATPTGSRDNSAARDRSGVVTREIGGSTSPRGPPKTAAPQKRCEPLRRRNKVQRVGRAIKDEEESAAALVALAGLEDHVRREHRAAHHAGRTSVEVLSRTCSAKGG
mmetsp:Transcript_2326/g.7875  ORF Transcript_2326/g.7875 Transcript_2326/m.7875 type:complete len:112 (+) Transcript_2326:671-1006(+)